MTRHVFTFLILCVSSNVFAQGAAPFWEPLSGPPGPVFSPVLFLPDSLLAKQVGGAVYLYDSTTNGFLPESNPEAALLHIYFGYPNRVLSSKGRNWIPYVYSSSGDSVFFSPDSSSTWRFVGTFGAKGDKSILYLMEMSSGRVVVIDDSNRMYLTTDTFATIDTEMAPDVMRGLSADADTLYLTSVHGNFYRSSDLGKSWIKLFGLHDTASNWYLTVARKAANWILYGFQRNPVYPFGDSNVFIEYSPDGGTNWGTMVNPEPQKVPQVDGIDNGGHIYLTFALGFDSCFRSDDWGRTWHKLLMPDQFAYIYVLANGVLFTETFYSLDLGETWDTISRASIACLPFDMISFRGATTVAMPNDRVYQSRDNGQTWEQYGYTTGYSAPYLSIRPDSSNWLMLNTTKRVYPSGGFGSLCDISWQISGLGTITSGFHVWLTGYNRHAYVNESMDSGCSYYSSAFDTLSATPIVQVLESAHDTILAVSQSGVYRGYDVLIPFDTVTPEPGTGATPTGVMMKDSTGAIYAAMSDGKLFVTPDGANTWQSFPSPTDGSAPIISLTASPNGLLFAADSNLTTGYTRTWQYDPTKQSWENVTSGLKRPGFSDTAEVTNIWYVNGYAYAGTWNMGLFRSLKPVGPVSSVASANHHTPFRLYPNPAGTSVTLQYPSYVKGSYRVVDMAGREALRGLLPGNGNSVTIDIHNLPNGIYDVSAGNGFIPVKLSVEH